MAPARQCRMLLHMSATQRGWTYIESDRIASSAPMESADQTAWAGVVPVQPWAPIESADQTARAGGRVSTTMVK